jgi:molecular chaperone DnaK
MSDRSVPAIGIDLGTTNSAIAWIDDLGRPVTLNNAEGDKLTPSVLLMEGENIVIGKEAVKAKGTDFDLVAECAKRELGNLVFSKTLGDRQYPPVVLQGWILHKLRMDAAQQIGDFSQVVVTVPAYFDEVRRKSTQDAGYVAGLDVLDIINEPTAAAIAYGVQLGQRDPEQAKQPQTILVYDLGGGTFDVTIMSIHGTQYVAKATDGDVLLGGRDWDQRLVDFSTEAFLREFGRDPREDANTAGRLWRECEDAKHTLSQRTSATIACDYMGNALRVEITRDELEGMTRDLLERTAFTTRQTLKEAGMDWGDIDRILLVGGSSRMPAVTAMLQKLSGRKLDASISPDEAVAHGAAMHAAALLDEKAGRDPRITVKNINSHSLGVAGTDPNTGMERTAVLIPRNTSLPVTARRVFKTQRVGQKSVLVNIVEGESRSPDDCTQIGSCAVTGLPADLPAHSSIEIRFRYRPNGRLTVGVSVEGTDIALQHEINRENTLNQTQLDAWRSHITGVPTDPEQWQDVT